MAAPGPVAAKKIIDSVAFERAKRHERSSLISRKYVAKWGLREMLRELVSNMMDEIYKFAARLPPKPVVDIRAGPDEKYELKAGEFDFYIDGLREMIIGRIRYDPAAKELRFINPGAIPIWALLIGGSSNMELTPEEEKTVIGRFGEGMKLAFLTACRLRKAMCVHTDGNIWTAALRYEPTYDTAVLHYDLGPDTSLTDPAALAEAKKWVTVVISDISLAEWQGTPADNTGVHSFLSLMQAQVAHNRDMDPLAIRAKEAKYGRLLLAPHVLGKVYNNGVFVTEHLQTRFGYDLVALTPNRDRGVLPDLDERRTATSNVLGDIIEYATEHKADSRALATSWRALIILVQQLLDTNSEETYHLHHYCERRKNQGSTQTADWLFEHWQDSKPDERVDSKSGAARRPLVYPETPDQALLLQKRFKAENISANVYPMEMVSWERRCNFVYSRHYVSLDARLAQLAALPAYDTLTAEQVVTRDAGIALAVRCDARLAAGGGAAAVVAFREAPIDQMFQLAGRTYLSRRLLDVPHATIDIAAALLDMAGTSRALMLRALVAT